MKKQIATVISELLEIDENLIEVQTPSNVEFGDFSVPCFAFEDYSVDVRYFVNDIGKQIAMLVLTPEGKKNIKFEDLLSLYVQVYNKLEDSL